MNNLRKILVIILALHLLFGSMSSVLAEEISPSPTPSENTQIQDPSSPQDPEDLPDEEITHGSGRNDPDNPGEPLGSGRNDPEPTPTPEVQASQSGTSSDGNVGDTFIDTGNADSNGNIFNTANSNLSAGAGCCGGSGVAVVNDGNGTGSTNTGSATVSENNTTNQTNSAAVNNGLTGASVTGGNSASANTGGDSFIDTGNASTTGTIITSANTNIDGVTVAEFNIVDDHVGDYILDFAASCVSGCDGFTGLAQNSNNGADSTNDATINSDTQNTTNQTNNGTVNNDLYLTADSGNKTASGNTGGDSYITTGDASVTGNVLTLLNNNLSGNVILGVVNIFGDLIGDIILPESALDAFFCATCGGTTTLVNSGNGSDSDNTVSSDQTIIDAINQVNIADIDNNLILTGNTGGNSASGNTGGDVYITTGNVDVTAQVLNIANNNLIGGNWWLVIINRAGQWIGQIVGAPQGANFAGSSGTEFAVDENGEITAINSNNGEGSTNDAKVYQSTKERIDQTNNADVNNNIYLSANTGKNSTNDNTGGDNYITTGDAKIVANLVNFVNNNIVGGRLLVTFVNVFGNWMGDFVTPGSHKENNSNPSDLGSAGIGGIPSSDSSSSNNGSSGGSGGSAGSSSGSVSSNSVPFVGGVLAGAVQRGILAIATETLQDSDNAQTLGVNTSGKEDPKKVSINLAWALLALPFIPLAYIARKRFMGYRLRRTDHV